LTIVQQDETIYHKAQSMGLPKVQGRVQERHSS
jgi:hypothetical protein